MITHVVLFKLKDASPANVERTVEVLLSMKGKIPGLKSLEVGADLVRSERSYDLALLSRFGSLQELDAYQKHPVHQEVLKFIASVKESSFSVDYET